MAHEPWDDWPTTEEDPGGGGGPFYSGEWPPGPLTGEA